MVDSNLASGRNDLNGIKEPEKEIEKEKGGATTKETGPAETEDSTASHQINSDQLEQSTNASEPVIPSTTTDTNNGDVQHVACSELVDDYNSTEPSAVPDDCEATLDDVCNDKIVLKPVKSGPDKPDLVLTRCDLAKVVAESLVNSKFSNEEIPLLPSDTNISISDVVSDDFSAAGDASTNTIPTLTNGHNDTDHSVQLLDKSLDESQDFLEFNLYSEAEAVTRRATNRDIGPAQPNPDSSWQQNESLSVVQDSGDRIDSLTPVRSSMESLEERPHSSSLFSPVTSTPRSRLSSTPCSGPHGHRTLPSTRASQGNTSVSSEGPLSLPVLNSGSKSYDYLLKVLLVGDSDVGKQEIITGMEDGSLDSPYCSSAGAAYKTTIILIDGKKVKLHIWDTSGQGRFCTIIRSYSRGAQGILLVYDITNRWSFEGINRWVREVEEHAPGIPKVLVGNRLHLAFKRQVDPAEAELYAEKHNMGFYEISPLVNFNITESFQELCRMALKRNGMERLWRSNRVLSLHELCCHAIVGRTNGYGIDKLPLPDAVKANLKSYAMTTYPVNRQHYKTLKERKKRCRPPDASATNCVNVSRKSCVIA